MIRRIELANFRGSGDLCLENLPAANLVTGHNGQGKTTLLEAVRFALLGRVYDATGKTVRLKDLIGPGGDSASVNLELDTGGQTVRLRARITSKGSEVALVDGNGAELTKGNQGARETLWSMLGVSTSDGEAAADPHHLLTSDKLDGWLAQHVIGEIDAGLVLENIAGEDRSWFTGFVEAEGLALTSLAGLSAVGQAAYDKRRGIARRIKQTEARLEEPEAPKDRKGRALTAADLPKVEQLISDLTGQRDALIYEQKAAEKPRTDKPTQSPDALRTTLEGLEQERAEKQEALSQATASVEQAKERINQARTAAAGKDRELALAKDRYEQAAARAAEVEDGRCPLCGYKLSDKKLEELKGSEQELAELKETVSGLESEYASAREEQDEAGRALEKANADLQSAQSGHEMCVSAIALTRGQLEAATSGVKDNRPLDEITADLNAVNERLANANGALSGLQALEGYKVQLEALEALRGEHAQLARIVRMFRDGHFVAALIEERKAAFLKPVNESLYAFGYAIDLAAEDSAVRVTLRCPHGGVPLSFASKGERVMVEWAVATVASRQQAPIAIDDLDGLDGRNKGRLIGELKRWGGAGGPVLAGAAWSLASEPDLDQLSTATHPVGVIWVHGEGASLHMGQAPQAETAGAVA